MANLFHLDELPKVVSVKPGRERIFFVGPELVGTDEVLVGVLRYKAGCVSPNHFHENCEHFYFILEGEATVETDEGVKPAPPGTLVFIPEREKHRLRAMEDMTCIDFLATNRAKTTVLDGTDDDLQWKRVDGKIWVQS